MPRRRLPFNGEKPVAAGVDDSGGARGDRPVRPQAPQSADEWLAYLSSAIRPKRTRRPVHERIAIRLLAVAPLTALVVWTGVAARDLVWSVAGLGLLGALLAFASGVLGHRQRLGASQTAYHTGVWLLQIAHVGLYVLGAVLLVQWVLS